MDKIVRIDDVGCTFDYLEEIVRCKDCKYYHEDSYGEDEWIMCRRTNLYTDEDKYCAWAERVKNGGD